MMEELIPITREELFLAKAGGMDVQTPNPISRRELFLQKIIDNMGGQGSGGNPDYVLTAADKEEIAGIAAGLVEVPEGSGGISVTGATVGQTVKIAAVDENGVPTAWAPVDFPSGGGGVEEVVLIDEELTEEVTRFDKTNIECSGFVEYFLSLVVAPTSDENITDNTALNATLLGKGGAWNLTFIDQWSNKSVPAYGTSSNVILSFYAVKVLSSIVNNTQWYVMRKYSTGGTTYKTDIVLLDNVNLPDISTNFGLSAPYGGKFGVGTKIKLVGRRYGV